MNKETIAKAISKASEIQKQPEHRLKWGQVHEEDRNWFLYLAGAVIKALEADVPKLLTKTRVCCSNCGASVSNEVLVEGELYIRAVVECADCLAKEKPAGPPKELEDCILTEKELDDVQNEWMSREDDESWSLAVMKAQLKKVVPFVEAVKKAERVTIKKKLTEGLFFAKQAGYLVTVTNNMKPLIDYLEEQLKQEVNK